MFCTGDPGMDLTRRAMLNDFGLVQHTVFESPDHNTVHVIYCGNNINFVHTELTKELETRTGLKLVPPQSPVATSSSRGDSVIIAIVGRHDSFLHRSGLWNDDYPLTDRLLRKAVETAGHPDTHTLFLQIGMYQPGWVNDKLARSTLMVYPESTLMVYPLSGVDRSQFWKTLTTLIG